MGLGGSYHLLYECKDENNSDNKIALIFAPYCSQAICETPGNFPKAWFRDGYQNLPVDDKLREQIKREKGISRFEDENCCEFDAADLLRFSIECD
jgi:hypothetical protein